MLYGVGICDVTYKVRVFRELPRVSGKRRTEVIFTCPYYSRWRDMLARCYSKRFKEKCPTYIESTVCADWLYLSNFKRWVESQETEFSLCIEDCQLDKDILFVNNKEYAEDKCALVPKYINTFVICPDSGYKNLLTGVTKPEYRPTFRANCSVRSIGGTYKNRYLGSYKTEIAAHKAWVVCKLSQAEEIRENFSNKNIGDALVKRYQDMYDGVIRKTNNKTIY